MQFPAPQPPQQLEALPASARASELQLDGPREPYWVAQLLHLPLTRNYQGWRMPVAEELQFLRVGRL